ncbi:MAG: hypothetical protein A2Z16_08275 [Chloroflexi bacterium RBG_16_54_18]|nr:MAG: hypothetical protein A2Z16_08275 [Chloroflexi bacterium RBG_16_54_18]
MDLSIVIPNNNRCKELELTLQSLCKQTYPGDQFEVIVVDQASGDGSRELVKKMKTPFQLRLLEQDQKYGISVARNAGMEAAGSPIVLILDADVLPAPEVVEAHVKAHRSSPGGLVCGRIMPYPPAYTTYIEQVANPEAGLDRGDKAGPIPFYQASGGHLSLSIDTYRKIGSWDPGLQRVQDIEFAYRAYLLNIPISNCPQAASYHNHPRTLLKRLEYAQTISWWPVLYQRYPEIKGIVPWISSFEPIKWGYDSCSSIKQKMINSIYSNSFIRWFLTQILLFLDHSRFLPKIIRGIFWRLYSGTLTKAFRDGQRIVSKNQDKTPVIININE